MRTHQCSGNGFSSYDLRHGDDSTVQFAIDNMDRDDTSGNDLNNNRIRFRILFVRDVYTFFGMLFKRE